MKAMLTIAAAALAVLAACGSSQETPAAESTTPAPSSSTSAAAEPSTTPTSGAVASAEDLVGTWSDPAAEWTVRFAADGSYAMDFQGNVDFQSGTYSYSDGTVTLSNDEGADEGTVTDNGSLEFRLGTLERQ